MSATRVVNLLDDFALGGVTKGLTIYDAPAFVGTAAFATLPIRSDAWLAPVVAGDVIITHFPPNWRRLAFLASLRARNLRATLVHVEHSYSAEWEALHVTHTARFRRMLRLAFSLVDHVVCVSRAQADWLLRIGAVGQNRLSVIHPNSPQPELADVAAMHLPRGAPLVVGAYGRFHDAKGFDTLIHAIRSLPASANISLRLGGFGPEEAALHAAAAGDARITFTGKVTDVSAFLGACHVVAVPSRYEAYGQVANEAREAGRPIIVSTAGGLPEQVGRAGLIVEGQDSATWAHSLAGLRSQPLEAMGRAGRAETAGCTARRVKQWLDLLTAVAPDHAHSQSRHPARQAVALASSRRKAMPMITNAGQHR